MNAIGAPVVALFVVWVMLNPSTADHVHDDPTIRRCMGFARAWGYGGIAVVNLYAWRATDPGFDYPWINFQTMFDMLASAITKAGGTDPLKVALALEGMQMNDMYGKPNIMRAADHQLLQPFYTAVFTRPVKNDSEKTGLGWKTQTVSTTEELTFPTNCKMKRPGGA